MNPFLIFPEPVWEEMLDNIEDPKDKLSVLGAHPLLELAFQKKKSEWQFNAAVPIVFDTLKSRKIPEIQKEARSERRKVKLNRLQKAFFNCRLVSSGTCKAIDKYLFSHCKKYGAPPEFYVGKGSIFQFIDPDLEMMKEMGNYPPERSPFIGRCFTLSIPIWFGDVRPGRGLFRSIEPESLKLLQNVGAHLLTLKLRIEFETVGYLMAAFVGDRRFRAEHWNRTRSILYVEKVLHFLPNLEKLSFMWNDRMRKDIKYPKELPFSALPELPSLKSLTLKRSRCSDGRVMLKHLQFDQYFPQLERLKLEGIPLWKKEFKTRKDLFANLRYLDLNEVYLGNFFKNRWLANLLEVAFDAPKIVQISIKPWWSRKTMKVLDFAEAIRSTYTKKNLEKLEKLGITWNVKTAEHLKTYYNEPSKIIYSKSQAKPQENSCKSMVDLGNEPEVEKGDENPKRKQCGWKLLPCLCNGNYNDC